MVAAPSAPVLQVRGLSFSHPGRHVFTDWSADFAPGLTWVRGSNGSGKSTLLQLLAGALPPLLGSLRVQGTCAADAPLAYRRQVFWFGPGAMAFDHLRVPEYLGFMRGLYPSFDAAAVAGHLHALGLVPFADKRLSALSTGTQRKVWLIAALCAGTPVVLLDEPLIALDAVSSRYLLQCLDAAAADPARAWVVASHDPLGAAGERAARIALD